MKTLLNNIKDRDYASENEKNVIDIFRKALEKHFNNEWTIIHNAFIPLINGEHMEIDLIIAKNNYPVAIVEIKPSLNNCRLPLIENQLHRAAVVLYAPLCIVCSPKEMLSCSANTGFDKNNIKVLNTENIRQVLAAADNNKNDNVTINKIKSKWEYILGSFDFETKKEVEQFITQIKECDVTNESNSFYLNEEKEDLLFRKLLGEYKKDDLCRFMTMNSIFRTCNEKAQSMCCIICMNDKSETDYATQKLNLTIQNDSEEINGCYIMSCCDIESKNNFTMWRLYADDAKGVCIEYKKEAFNLFNSMMSDIQSETVRHLFRARFGIQIIDENENPLEDIPFSDGVVETETELTRALKNSTSNYVDEQPKEDMPKIGRNDPCPCGSGLKYKKCCGKGKV